MLEIIDYNKCYADEVDKLDIEYWGKCESTNVSEDIKQNDIVKLALIDNKLVGLLHFKPIGNLLDCYHVLVDNNFQRQGIASSLMSEALKEAENRKFKTLIAHAVEHDGKVNARKLLEKFGFIEVYSVNNYWDSLYPNEFCKQCGNNSCHCGVVVFMKNNVYRQ